MDNCRCKQGFSVVEVLVVIAILATLAALLFPVYYQSKKQAYISVDVQKLHQCQIATSLYQQDNDSLGVGPYHLPLPPDWLEEFSHHQSFYGTKSTDWESACGWHPLSRAPTFVAFSAGGQDSLAAYATNGEKTILIANEECNDEGVDVSSSFVTKLGLGVLVDGTLVRRIHQGNVYTFAFWNGVSQ
jgi:prepilin-type N-terminal cleavage/methylation domain-containing protein